MAPPLPFRRRIFVILVVMTVVPTVLAVAGWVLSVRRLLPAAGARASTERVAATARALLEGVDTLHLTVRERALLRDHLNEVSASVSLARRAETFLRYYTAGFAVVILLLGAAVLYAAVNLAGHLSRQLSRPIDELVGWTQLIRRHELLPIGADPRRAGVRGTAASAARAGRRAHRGAGAGAGGRAAARVPGSRAPRGPRDQESVDIDADCRGPAGAGGRSVGRPDGHCRASLGSRNGSPGAACQGVLGVRQTPRGSAERGGRRRAPRGIGADRSSRPSCSPAHGARRTTHAVRPLRTAASRLREPLSQRRRGNEGERRDRRDGHRRRIRSRSHDRRPRSRHPRRPPAAGVRAVLHDEG